MDDPYAVMGEAITDSLPPGWKKAWLSFTDVGPDFAQLSGDYVNSAGAENWFSIPDSELAFATMNAVIALRQDMAAKGQGNWSSGTFTLHPDGSFRFEPHYED